jgi:hypothetical protein
VRALTRSVRGPPRGASGPGGKVVAHVHHYVVRLAYTVGVTVANVVVSVVLVLVMLVLVVAGR